MAAEHAFECEGQWQGMLMKGAGSVRAGQIAHAITVPREMGGSGQGSNPEELLVAAANSCYLMTLAAVLQVEGVAFVSCATAAALCFQAHLRVRCLHI